MKKVSFIISLAGVLLLSACGPSQPETAKPKPGAEVATAEMQLVDNVDHAKFSISVLADSSGKPGVYIVNANSGPYSLSSQFTMPKNGEELPIKIKTGPTPNSFLVGFNLPDDTAFYDYYEVRSNRDTIKMRYVKAYSFDTK